MAYSQKINKETLLKRLSHLVKQNKELKQENEDLIELNDKLLDENEEQKIIISKLREQNKNIDIQPVEKQKSLKFKLATVLFVNIHGFSKISDDDDIDSSVLMDELDKILFQFDNIIKKYNIEKIKTIGDSYMCAGGIPQKNLTNPVQIVLAALEMADYMRQVEEDDKLHNMWWIKLGINTGPLTANISGKRKISYDIKGDTVNIASRIEAACDPGQIVMSEITYILTRELFTSEYYGRLPVKYKNDLELYNVKSIKPEYSDDENGSTPNKAFRIKFGLTQFMDIQELILDKLEKELPEYLYYHNVKHTVDVVTQAELIGWAEGCTDEEILLLKTAALFHDAGHIIAYDNHEYFGTEMVREMLPNYNYDKMQIETICNIIMATKLPPNPNTLLEKIICDSDLDYLGRSDMIPVSNTLYEELKAQNKIGSLNDWNNLQIKFISAHQYFTNTAQSLREVNKQKQIERIKSLIIEE